MCGFFQVLGGLHFQALASRETEARAQRLGELEREQRRREAEATVHEHQRTFGKLNRQEEVATRQVLSALEAERARDREMEMEMQLKAVELKERLMVGNVP
jgi:hypothetical protein